MNDYEKISSECKAAISLDKYNSEAYEKWREAIKNLPKPDQALNEYQSVIKENLDTSNAYNDFGNLLFSFERYAEAIEQYKNALEKDDKYVYAIHNTGLSLERLKKYEEATKWFRKSIELDANYKEAYNSLGYTLCKLNRYEESIRNYKKALELDPKYLIVYTNWREAIVNLPEPDQAIAEYEAAIVTYLDTSEAYNDLGNLFFNLERYPDAIEQYKKSIEKDIQFKYGYFNWGLSLDRLKKYDEAIEYYKKSIEIDPQYLVAYTNWREVIKKLQKQDEALLEYQSLIGKNLDTTDAFTEYGNLLFDLGKYAQSIEQYAIAINKDPKSKIAHFNLGLGLEKLLRYDEAIESYQKVIEIDSEYGLAYQSLGWAFITTKKPDKAIETFKLATQKIDKNKDAYFGWAYALENTWRYDEAFEKYEMSFQFDENDPFPIHNIAALNEKLGRYGSARKKWKEACDLYEKKAEEEKKNGNPDYFQYYGSIYQFSTLQDLEKAENIYNTGLTINPDHTGILLYFGRLCLAKRNELSEKSGNDTENRTKSEMYFSAMKYFRRAEGVLKARFENDKSADTLAELGSLYKEMENYKDAEDYLAKALILNNAQIKGLTSIGAVHMQNENYKKAIINFKDATKLEPDNLEIRSNLAEAYLKAGLIDASEKEYREILDITPSHMDSLIGIGQTYITMGEDANTRKDFSNAELMFSTADNYYCETIRLMQQPENASKILNKFERSSVFYSKGYNEVMLCEIQKKQDTKRLKMAIEYFRKVEKWTPNYYKAQRAITKINERINPQQGMLHKVGPMLILVFSLVVFILAQLLFTFGKPVLGFSGYTIDKNKLEMTFIKKALDPSVIAALKSEFEQKLVFTSPDDLANRIKREFGDSIASTVNPSELLQKSGGLTVKAFQPLESGYYVLITFGCLLFMIAGLYLSEISKLKVGALELEKSTIDQISTSSSLGITR